MFITFNYLYDDSDGPGTEEELEELIFGDKLPEFGKSEPMTISISSIEKYFPMPEDSSLTELCTLDGDVITVDEEFKSFDKRVKQESGQEPRETWTLHQSEDEIVKIRTYHN